MGENYGDTVKTRYVAMYKTGAKGQDYFKFIYLAWPRWLMPPPIIEMTEQDGFKIYGKNRLIEFVRADTQAEIAQAFGIKQQAVSRYMRNSNPYAPTNQIKKDR